MKTFGFSQLEQLTDIVRRTRPLFEDSALLSHVHQKGPADFVTEVDSQVQTFLFTELTSLFPNVQCMGEEKDNSDINFSGWVWILDPVDGTTNLMHHFHQSSVSLALTENRTIIAGIIYNPYTDELFSSLKGNGAYLNGQPIQVSPFVSLEDSLISIGTSPYYREFSEWSFSKAKEIFLKCQDIRRSGSAALDLAYVACGRSEAYFEKLLFPWDYAAGWLLVEEAGGTISTLTGDTPNCALPSSILATNGKIHETLKTLLNQ